MLFTRDHVQNEFNRVEKLFRKEVPEHKTSKEADNGGYKEMLRAYANINDTAFEVLYDEQTSDYEERPQDFHLYNDTSRVAWFEVLEQLQMINHSATLTRFTKF